jgi:hypothetical protein
MANFVRAESEFLSLFERNEEIEEIKVAEIEEEKYERHICNEIIRLKKTHFDLKTVFVLVVVFLIFGFLLQAVQESHHSRKRPSKEGRPAKPVKASKTRTVERGSKLGREGGKNGKGLKVGPKK